MFRRAFAPSFLVGVMLTVPASAENSPQLVGGTLGRPHRGPLLSRVSRAAPFGRRATTGKHRRAD